MNDTIKSVSVRKLSKEEQELRRQKREKNLDQSVDPELEDMNTKVENNDPLEGMNPTVK